MVDGGYVYVAIEDRFFYAIPGFYKFVGMFRNGFSKYFGLRAQGQRNDILRGGGGDSGR